MAQGRRLKLKLFLEGIEVDVLSATVQVGINQPASAQIAIPAPPYQHQFKPRTLVHLFFYEDTFSASPDVTAEGSNIPPDSWSADAAVGPAALAESWRLLFCGEVLAFSRVKNGSARHLSLSCQDFTSYWQQAQLYWGTGSTAYSGMRQAIAAGATQIVKPGVGGGGTSTLLRLLSARPVTFPTLPGILGGVVSLLEAATGVFDPSRKQNFRGVTDFLSQAEMRLHLTRTLAASPDDDTSDVFLRYGDMRAYFQQFASSVQSTASFMDIVNAFLGKIYHQTASIAAPPYRPKGSAEVTMRRMIAADNYKGQPDLVKVLNALDSLQTEVSARLEKTADREGDVLTSGSDRAVVKAKADGGEEPDIDGHKTFNNAVVNVPGGFFDDAPINAATPINASSKGAEKVQGILDNLAKDKVLTESVSTSDVRNGLTLTKDVISKANAIRASGSNGTQSTVASDTFPNHNTPKLKELAGTITAAQDQLRKGLSRPMKVQVVKGRMESSLNMTTLSPDLFMVPPPKCNVLFPNQYMHAQYSRSWMSETTRLVMHGRYNSGQQALRIYFAPNRTTGLIGPGDITVERAVLKGLSFLMPHELFTGPVPAIDSLGDMTVFKRLNAALIAEEKKTGHTPLYEQDDFFQRAANFLFVSKRFEGRSMQVEARFSPQLLTGLPLLLLDPEEGPPDPLTGIHAPSTHYVGQVLGLTHTFDAQGGSGTSVQLAKCREHWEGPELLGDGDLYTRVKRITTKRKLTPPPFSFQHIDMNAANAADQLRSMSVGWGVPAEKRNASGDLTNGTPVGTGSRDTACTSLEGQPDTMSDRLSISFTSGGKSYEVHAVAQGQTEGDPKGNQAPVIDVTQEQTTTKRTPFTLSFEMAYTPPWFSKIFLPFNIGQQYYNPLFGCRSVVDEPELQPLVVGSSAQQPETAAPDIHDNTPMVLQVGQDPNSTVSIPGEYVRWPAGTTKDAADRLATIWRALLAGGADTNYFVGQFTRRGYATLPDIFGAPPSALDDLAAGQEPTYRQWITLLEPLLFKGGAAPGFHEDAYGDLTGLTRADGTTKLQEIPLATTVSKKQQPILRTVNPAVDSRAAKYAAVQSYTRQVAKRRSNRPG